MAASAKMSACISGEKYVEKTASASNNIESSVTMKYQATEKGENRRRIEKLRQASATYQ